MLSPAEIDDGARDAAAMGDVTAADELRAARQQVQVQKEIEYLRKTAAADGDKCDDTN